ncbi:hypothetical protein GGD64_000269 [Bradyrhizobium sp. CIR3A]|nr:hypothetical protein [Bradyrhizobium sp. CIR3A]
MRRNGLCVASFNGRYAGILTRRAKHRQYSIIAVSWFGPLSGEARREDADAAWWSRKQMRRRSLGCFCQQVIKPSRMRNLR